MTFQLLVSLGVGICMLSLLHCRLYSYLSDLLPRLVFALSMHLFLWLFSLYLCFKSCDLSFELDILNSFSYLHNLLRCLVIFTAAIHMSICMFRTSPFAYWLFCYVPEHWKHSFYKLVGSTLQFLVRLNKNPIWNYRGAFELKAMDSFIAFASRYIAAIMHIYIYITGVLCSTCRWTVAV